MMCALFPESNWGQTAPDTIVAERLLEAEWPVAMRPASHAVDEKTSSSFATVAWSCGTMRKRKKSEKNPFWI